MINKIVLILLIINFFIGIYQQEGFSFICMTFTALIYCARVVVYER